MPQSCDRRFRSPDFRSTPGSHSPTKLLPSLSNPRRIQPISSNASIEIAPHFPAAPLVPFLERFAKEPPINPLCSIFPASEHYFRKGSPAIKPCCRLGNRAHSYVRRNTSASSLSSVSKKHAPRLGLVEVILTHSVGTPLCRFLGQGSPRDAGDRACAKSPGSEQYVVVPFPGAHEWKHHIFCVFQFVLAVRPLWL